MCVVIVFNWCNVLMCKSDYTPPSLGRKITPPMLRPPHTLTDHRQHERHLRPRTDVARPSRRPRRRIEDARYPIRLGQQRTVHRREADADADALRHARPPRGRRQQRKGVGEAQQAAAQQHVAELAPGGPDQRRVVVPHEQPDHAERRHDAAAGDEQRHRGKPAAPADVLDRQRVARVLVRVRPVAGRTGATRVLVVHVLVVVARIADPAAGVALLLANGAAGARWRTGGGGQIGLAVPHDHVGVQLQAVGVVEPLADRLGKRLQRNV